jgi:hypothetical protein
LNWSGPHDLSQAMARPHRRREGQLMAYSQHPQHRIDALPYGAAAQSPCFWNGRGQQAYPGDNDQFPGLPRCASKAEHSAQILDRDHLRSKHIRYAYRVDEFGTHVSPMSGLMPDRTGCTFFEASTSVHNLKIESKQPLSGKYPQDSIGVFTQGMPLMSDRKLEHLIVYGAAFAIVIGLTIHSALVQSGWFLCLFLNRSTIPAATSPKLCGPLLIGITAFSGKVIAPSKLQTSAGLTSPLSTTPSLGGGSGRDRLQPSGALRLWRLATKSFRAGLFMRINLRREP